jgi:DNA-binding transcriptional MerR regulator
MLISEASKISNLTKKAIEYYTEQKLVLPVMLDNGYRDFSENDVERLKRISVFRKLGLNIEEIKAVLADETNNTLLKISVQKELNMQKEQVKKSILNKLHNDADTIGINAGLQSGSTTDGSSRLMIH